MDNSRRRLLLGIGTGAVAATATPSLAANFLHYASNSVLDKAIGQPIRLDRSENPYGPSPRAIAAMRESLDRADLYPETAELEEKIAAHHKVKVEQVVLGCGSSEILKIAAFAFLKPGKKLLTPSPTFPMLPNYVRSQGIEVLALSAVRRT